MQDPSGRLRSVFQMNLNAERCRPVLWIPAYAGMTEGLPVIPA